MSVFALRRRVLATERTEIARRRFSLDARRRAFVSSSADSADLAPTMGVRRALAERSARLGAQAGADRDDSVQLPMSVRHCI